MSHDSETEDLLRSALTDEASLVDPSADGLGAIQRRTRAASTSHKRRWVFGSMSAGLATAAVVTAIVMVGSSGTPDANTPVATNGTSDDPNPTGPPTGAVQEPTAHQGVYDPSAPADEQFTMYYQGLRQAMADGKDVTPIYPETHTITNPGADRTLAAINEFLTSTPIDNDYGDPWSDSISAESVTSEDGVTTIHLVNPLSKVSIEHVPPTASMAGMETAPELLVLSSGITGPVQFTFNGDLLRSIWDVDVAPTYTAPAYDTSEDRAPITIDISNGQTLSSPVSIPVTGNTYEGGVIVRVYDADNKLVFDQPITTSQGMWTQVPVEIGPLHPGTYTIKAWEPSGMDGSPLFTDDKTFTVG